MRAIIALLFVLSAAKSQNTQFPLESLSLEGTRLSKEIILDISNLRIGTSVDQAVLEVACQKLTDSGIFDSVTYRYAPGPKRGYALTLTLADKGSLVEAAIDLPGFDEALVWQWLVSQFPAFNRKVPGNETAQQFIAQRIQDHLSAQLEGQRIVGRLEAEFAPRKRMIISFQPETLPQITSLNFSGVHELSSARLTEIIQPMVKAQGYTDRHFREIVELNLRPAYEEHGMYGVRFTKVTMKRIAASSVEITTEVDEGAKFTLGEVRLSGENLPMDAMLKAARFKKGQMANWTEIQQGIWELEKPVKRTGYFDAAAQPERVLHDTEHVLDINIPIVLGPFYRFGQLTIEGLSPALESHARKIWKLQPGDPFDYDYPNDFFKGFFQSVDSRKFKKFDVKMNRDATDHKMDFKLVFESL